MNSASSDAQRPRAADIPAFLYGTAWKEDETGRLVQLALEQGFVGIDTANQRKHYHEAGVGAGIAGFLRHSKLTRRDLFLQTKFTFRGGQDHRLPYDANSPIAQQVEDSFASSLDHLCIDYLDSYVLHGPMFRSGLSGDDWSAWQAMEELHDTGKVRYLGISNVSLEQLEMLCSRARIRPSFVQNRCYANRGWDWHVRQFCLSNGMTYQGFSLLTANRDVLTSAWMTRIAKTHGRSANEIVFRFAIDVGMLPLTGTTNAEHMRADLQVTGFQLRPDEIQQIERGAVG